LAKPEIVVPESDSGILFPKFPVKWRIMQFFYLLCSQFRQKDSSWINKTLLLVKQQKWLSKFCVKIHRVGLVTVNTFIFFWPKHHLLQQAPTYQISYPSLTFCPNFCIANHPCLLLEVVHQIIKHFNINNKHWVCTFSTYNFDVFYLL
jgi:hypothetical protein